MKCRLVSRLVSALVVTAALLLLFRGTLAQSAGPADSEVLHERRSPLAGEGRISGGVVGSGTPASCTESALSAALAGGGTITFNCGPSPVSILLTKPKTIAVATTVDGDVLGRITISGGDTVRIFDITATANVKLLNLVLAHGKGTSGGAIRNFGTLSVSSGRITASTASYGGGLGNYGAAEIFATEFDHNTAGVNGGAIDSTGSLTVINATVHDNSAVHRGGGLYNYLGKVEIQGTWVTTNTTGSYGGGIGNDGGTLVGSYLVIAGNQAGRGGGLQNNGTADIRDTFVRTNRAVFEGAGIGSTGVLTLATTLLDQNLVPFAPPNNDRYGGGIAASGKLTGIHLTFSSNTAPQGGGLAGGGDVDLVQTRFTNCDAYFGGGIYVHPNGVLRLQDSVLLQNRAWWENAFGSWSGTGGGMQNEGQAWIDSTAFVSNSAAFFGGGIQSESGLTVITNSTVDGNFAYYPGSGIHTESTSAITIVNSTISDNISSEPPANLSLGGAGGARMQNTIVSSAPGVLNCAGAPLSLGNNLSSDGSCNLNAPGDMSNTAALLLPMNAGGPYYREPAPGSPAINHGNNAACPPHDQRGFPRPLGGVCDIGAIEVLVPAQQFIPLISRGISDFTR